MLGPSPGMVGNRNMVKTDGIGLGVLWNGTGLIDYYEHVSIRWRTIKKLGIIGVELR